MEEAMVGTVCRAIVLACTVVVLVATVPGPASVGLAAPVAPGRGWCRPDTILVILSDVAAADSLEARYGGTWAAVPSLDLYIVTVDRSTLRKTLAALRSEPAVA